MQRAPLKRWCLAVLLFGCAHAEPASDGSSSGAGGSATSSSHGSVASVGVGGGAGVGGDAGASSGPVNVANAMQPYDPKAHEWHVAPDGTGTSCSLDAPCSLKTALCDPSPCAYPVAPGDQIWVHKGTYQGAFVVNVAGTAEAPVVVRNWNGERATIDGNDPGTTQCGAVTVSSGTKDAYVWLWGLEIMNSCPVRTYVNGDDAPNRHEGVCVFGIGAKMIDCVDHDNSQGVLASGAGVDSELYGNLIYYNGDDDPATRGHGHGIYIQNMLQSDGTYHPKYANDNIVHDQFGYGFHGYTENGQVSALYYQRNISFDNGRLSHVTGATPNLFIGANGAASTSCNSSLKVAQQPHVIDNVTYHAAAELGLNMGYDKGACDITVTGNYFADGGPQHRAMVLVAAWPPIEISGNTFYGSVGGFAPSDYPNNAYLTDKPKTNVIVVRPNVYEPGRANVAIYNWQNLTKVPVDLSSVVAVGARYEIRNVYDFYGSPLASGTYSGGTVDFPMSGIDIPDPIGWEKPSVVPFPEFMAFVVISDGGSPK